MLITLLSMHNKNKEDLFFFGNFSFSLLSMKFMYKSNLLQWRLSCAFRNLLCKLPKKMSTCYWFKGHGLDVQVSEQKCLHEFS